MAAQTNRGETGTANGDNADILSAFASRDALIKEEGFSCDDTDTESGSGSDTGNGSGSGSDTGTGSGSGDCAGSCEYPEEDLLDAVENVNIEKLRCVLECPGVNINHLYTHINRRTALGHAAAKGHLDVVRLLLSRPDIDVNAGEHTPLYLATRDFNNSPQKYDIAKILLNNSNIDVNKGSYQISGLDPRHPLYDPAQSGDIKMVELLMNHTQTDVNNRGYEVKAFHAACLQRRTEVVKIFLRCPRTDLTVRDRYNLTAIDTAKDHGSFERFFATEKNHAPINPNRWLF